MLLGIALVILSSFENAHLLILYGGIMAMPLVTIYHCDVGWPRQMMTLSAACMGLTEMLSIACTIAELKLGETLFIAFFFGFIATPWLANYLAEVTPFKLLRSYSASSTSTTVASSARFVSLASRNAYRMTPDLSIT